MKKTEPIYKVLPQMVEGVKNYVWKDEDIEQLHAHRIAICQACDKFQKASQRCGVCGCFMQVKTRSPSAHCPLNKW